MNKSCVKLPCRDILGTLLRPSVATEALVNHNQSFASILFVIILLFVASLTPLVSSQPKYSSETVLLGKLVGDRAQSPVRYSNK